MSPHVLCISLLATSLPFFVISTKPTEPALVNHARNQKDLADPVVKFVQGLLRGEVLDSAAGGTYYSFKGIPYAQPPVGQLRFKDAEPPLAWEGVRNATAHGSVCPQLVNFTEYFGAEDCLFLNVYTPKLPGQLRTKLPVMFWIHGGGFYAGSGNSEIYGPDYLVSEQVVVVTFNYRLGPLGFLYMESVAPGNVGMKDQVAALRWVQRNIAAFGGDPGKVTIFGESSGGGSVFLLMLSPMTKGLFRAAIGQSGYAVNNYYQWGNATARRRPSLQLASTVGCGDAENASAAVECLRALNASALLAATSLILNTTEQLLPLLFLPNIDTEAPGIPRFLTELPIEQMIKGQVHPVPYMNGFNEIEAYDILSLYNYYDESVANEFEESWNKLILPLLRVPINNETLNNEMVLELRNFFMGGQPLRNETVLGFLDMLSDILVCEGSYFTSKVMAKNHKASVFQYHFTVDDEFNVQKLFSGFQFKGAMHADDLGYLFRIYSLPELPSNSSAAIARARMVRLWTNFAKYGTPTFTPDPLLRVTWSPYTTHVKNFLEIGPILRRGKGLNSERVAFWESFYRKYSPEVFYHHD